MARTRTTKKLAQRIDLNYFKRPTPFKRAKRWLSVLVPLLAVGWIACRGIVRDSRVYSSGRLSEPHAVFERQCTACHAEKVGEFSSKATDSACLACHDGPMHHENEIASAVPNCSTCHREHRGSVNLSAVSTAGCVKCHGSLKVGSGPLHYAANIYSFGDGHPEFASLRDGPRDGGTILVNHAVHMKPIRQGPNGPIVQLECTDCHRNYQATWKYTLSPYPVMSSYQLHRDFPIDNLPRALPTLKPFTPEGSRARMRPVEFARACSGCHLLTFDKRFEEGVPHDTPEVVHAFLSKKFEGYIETHPAEVREPESNRGLAGKPLQPQVRLLTQAQWVAERTADAEELLWRKTCKQCHQLERAKGSSLPSVAPGRVVECWLPHAKFDHDAHRGFSCVSCHRKALTSTDKSDILVPGIDNCKTCHAAGGDHAESRCFECHTYHDWSKRKEVVVTFTLPSLPGRGQ